MYRLGPLYWPLHFPLSFCWKVVGLNCGTDLGGLCGKENFNVFVR